MFLRGCFPVELLGSFWAANESCWNRCCRAASDSVADPAPPCEPGFRLSAHQTSNATRKIIKNIVIPKSYEEKKRLQGLCSTQCCFWDLWSICKALHNETGPKEIDDLQLWSFQKPKLCRPSSTHLPLFDFNSLTAKTKEWRTLNYFTLFCSSNNFCANAEIKFSSIDSPKNSIPLNAPHFE